MRPGSSSKPRLGGCGPVRSLGASGLWAFVALLLGTLIIAAACASENPGPTQLRDDSFSVGPAPKLEVDNENGRIVVNAGADGTIRVQASVRKAPRVEYNVSQSGNTVMVEAYTKAVITGPEGSSDITVTVPRDTSVELKTENGNVELWRTIGSGTLATTNGEVVMVGVVGEFDASTVNGDITFDGAFVPGGDNEFSIVNGSAILSLQREPNLNIDASTTTGSVRVRLQTLQATIDKDTHVVGTVGDGEADLKIRSVNGTITVR